MKLTLFSLLLLVSQLLIAQEYSLFGYITDATTGEALIGANLFLPESARGTVTNEYGYFSLPLGDSSTVCQFSYVGYEKKILELHLKKDTMINIQLSSKALSEVVVTDEKVNQKNALSSMKIPIQTLTRIPTIGAETDIMKSLALFPGISTGQEGSSNLYIRGGTPDQNLILLDGIPVYNATHLGGFVSVFNTNAINNVDIYKGNFPARYGGRLSSVIDISMKEGNNQSFQGKAGIGLLSSHLALEGPIQKGKSSYLFTARSSYFGLVNLFINQDDSGNKFDYWLYDINFKSNFQLKKGKLFFSLYTGNDIGINNYAYQNYRNGKIYEDVKENSNIKWGNTTMSTRYTLPIGKRLYGKFLVGMSNYHYSFKSSNYAKRFYEIDTISISTEYEDNSKISDILLQANFDYTINSTQLLKYGAGVTFHDFDAASSSFDLGIGDTTKQYISQDYYAFIEDEIQWHPKLTTNIGLRWSAFVSNKKQFSKWEPRVNMTYLPNSKWSFNTSFSVSQQYIHLLSSNSFGFPNDIWVPATENVPPQESWQFAIGGQREFNPSISFSMEAYYKKMTNLIDYKVGENGSFAKLGKWEEIIEKGGKGEAYGIEWFLQKKMGKLTAFLAYTLSWNFRQFENISLGEKYPFTYDRRHDISLVLSYHLSDKWLLSANWVYQTGTALTLPVASLPTGLSIFNSVDEESLHIRGTHVFSGRNNARMPNYHRLDIGFEYHKKTKRNRLLIWKASIYNGYNRQNPSVLYINSVAVLDSDDQYLYGRSEVIQETYFPFLPAISLEYQF